MCVHVCGSMGMWDRWVKLLLTEYWAINIIALIHSLTQTHANTLTYSYTQGSLSIPFTSHDVICFTMLVPRDQGRRLCWCCGQGLVGLKENQSVTRFTHPTPKPPPTHPLTLPSAASSVAFFQHTEWITSWPSLEILWRNNPTIYEICTQWKSNNTF